MAEYLASIFGTEKDKWVEKRTRLLVNVAPRVEKANSIKYISVLSVWTECLVKH